MSPQSRNVGALARCSSSGDMRSCSSGGGNLSLSMLLPGWASDFRCMSVTLNSTVFLSEDVDKLSA